MRRPSQTEIKNMKKAQWFGAVLVVVCLFGDTSQAGDINCPKGEYLKITRTGLSTATYTCAVVNNVECVSESGSYTYMTSFDQGLPYEATVRWARLNSPAGSYYYVNSSDQFVREDEFNHNVSSPLEAMKAKAKELIEVGICQPKISHTSEDPVRPSSKEPTQVQPDPAFYM